MDAEVSIMGLQIARPHAGPLASVLSRGNVHPLCAELVAEALAAVAAEEIARADQAKSEDVLEVRNLLADLVAQAVLGQSPRTRAAHVGVLGLAALAEAHYLDDPHGLTSRALRAEQHLVRLAVEWEATLRPATLALARAARDRIACSAGRAEFIRQVRQEVEGLVALDPSVVDLDEKEALLLGGQHLRVGYRTSSGSRLRRLSTGNREGRLLLLVLADRAPDVADSDLVSRIRQALERASGGSVRLLGPPYRTKPSLRLSARAQALATEIRCVDSRDT